MAGASDQNNNGAADQSAELGRMAAELLLKSPFLAMNPTLVPPTAALAAATIIGFGLSTQVASAFFGALQGAMEVANRFNAEHGNEAAAEAHRTNGAAAPQPNGVADDAEARQTEVATAAGDGAASSGTAEQLASGSAPKLKRNAKKTVEADDLKRISGIGPKLEQMLNGLGIRAVEQIAGWTDDDVTRIDAALGVDGRIARDDWVAQAKKLAA